jgi:hypothetical protein
MFLLVLASDALWARYEALAPLVWAGLVLLVLLLIGAIVYVVNRRVRNRLGRRREADLLMLKSLEGGSGLTEEERKKVRAALARKYMQGTEEPAKRPTGLSPLAELAIEAQRLEEEARARAAQQRSVEERASPAPTTGTWNSLPDAEPEGQPAKANAGTDAAIADLPPMMRKLLDKPDVELEDMVSAGLISEEDLAWVRRVRSTRS